MTFLPIVERELRVAARRKLTYWSRVIAAAFILMIFSAILAVFSSAQAGGGMFSIGTVEFSIIRWIVFVAACAAGVFLTADSLSEEKREGTLGLLFLTDLRGYDVVLGKLISHSLRAFYGLLAAFPILALPLLMGGVSGTDFGRAMLVIGNTLFLSLAVGMFASAISREVLNTMNVVIIVMLGFLVVLPLSDFAFAHWDFMKFKCILSRASPAYLFIDSGRMPVRDYWLYLGLQHFLGWCFLVLASFCVPLTWQERTIKADGLWRRWISRWRFGGPRGRLAFRHKLLKKNPVVWLAMRNRSLSRLMLMTTISVPAALLAENIYSHREWQNLLEVLEIVLWLLTIVCFLWICIQACNLFVDSIGSGAMELILVTPVTPRQVVKGQRTALWRIFILPVMLLLLLYVGVGVNHILATKKAIAASTNAGGINQNFDWLTAQIVSLITGFIFLGTNFIALAWFGMWQGLTNRKTSIATLKTICFVFLLPWLLETFMVQIILLAFISTRPSIWWGTILTSVLDLAKVTIFILLSRRALAKDFREKVAQAGRSRLKRKFLARFRSQPAATAQP